MENYPRSLLVKLLTFLCAVFCNNYLPKTEITGGTFDSSEKCPYSWLRDCNV